MTGKKRIYYLDFARGLAVFFMVMQHAVLIHGQYAGEGSNVLGNILVLLGTAPAAPVFMTVMGIFMAKSRASGAALLKRGVLLFATGYLLNLLRFTLPLLIGGERSALPYFFYVDILQLAGLSFIVFAGIRALTTKGPVIPVIIIAVLLLSPYLWNLPSCFPVGNPLWGGGEFVSFPLFPWIIYPLLGIFLSPHLARNDLSDKLRLKLLISAVLLAAAGAATFRFFPYGEYERLGLGASLLIIAFVIGWLLLIEKIISGSEKIKNSRAAGVVYFWSMKVTNIYFLQWIIFGWSMLILDSNMLNENLAAAIGLAVMTVTDLLIRYTAVEKILPSV